MEGKSTFSEGTIKNKLFLPKIRVPVLSFFYLAWLYFTSGIRDDQVMLVILVNFLYFFNGSTRRFIIAFSVFVVYWILYDSMKLYPNYQFHEVDIEGLYSAEKSLFGIMDGSKLLTPNEYFLLHTNPVVDVFGALFYLCWIPVPLLFAFYLFRINKQMCLRFSIGFFVTNLLAFAVYYSHPAAPPWYVQEYGFVLHPEIKSYAAGLLRFDHYFGVNLFEGLYSKGSNVFAAMPSLHAAYPILRIFLQFEIKNGLAMFFLFIMSGIWFSAVYLTHHYILDVLGGIFCAIAGITLWERYLLKKSFFVDWLRKFELAITPSN